MGAPGEQPAFHQTQGALGLDGAVLGDGGLGAGLALFLHKDLILLRVLEEIALQLALGRRGLAVDAAEVVFLDLPLLDLVVQDPERLGVFRGDDDAASVPVDPVAEGGGEAVLRLGIPLTLQAQIGLDVGDQGVPAPVPGAVAEDAGLLVGQEDVLILIDDVQPGRGDLQMGVVLGGLFEKLVVDV